jgi:hypothetical protein
MIYYRRCEVIGKGSHEGYNVKRAFFLRLQVTIKYLSILDKVKLFVFELTSCTFLNSEAVYFPSLVYFTALSVTQFTRVVSNGRVTGE